MHRLDPADISAKARKLGVFGATGLVVDVLAKLLEHRILSWANEEIDRHVGSAFVAVIANGVRFITEHPIETAWDIIALYGLGVVGWALISTARNNRSQLRSANGCNADLLRLMSPYGINVCVAKHADGPVSGLLLRIESHRVTNLEKCRVLIRDAQSLDSQHSRFRQSSGFKPLQIETGQHQDLPAGERTPEVFLVMIKGDHLEVGNTHGMGILMWPRADLSQREVWRLEGYLNANDLDPWKFAVRVEWLRGTEEISVKSTS